MEFNRIADLKRLQFIIDTLKKNLPARSVVLDVGCGNGVISRNLGRYGYNVFGIDVSEKAIFKAKELNESPGVNLNVIGTERLVRDGNKYIAVISRYVLEHLN